MRILLLNTVDQGGGAASVAFNLYRSYRHRGHDARMLVGFKYGNEETLVSQIDPYAHTSLWAPLCALGEQWVRRLPKFRGQYRLVQWLRRAAWPRRWVDHRRGLADYNYPYSYRLLDDPAWRPEVIHAHNLHGNYFDLRAVAVSQPARPGRVDPARCLGAERGMRPLRSYRLPALAVRVRRLSTLSKIKIHRRKLAAKAGSLCT